MQFLRTNFVTDRRAHKGVRQIGFRQMNEILKIRSQQIVQMIAVQKP